LTRLTCEIRMIIEKELNYMAFPKLEPFRKTKGWSIKFISKKLNVPYETWRNWEKDRNTPPEYTQDLIMEELKRIAKGEN